MREINLFDVVVHWKRFFSIFVSVFRKQSCLFLPADVSLFKNLRQLFRILHACPKTTCAAGAHVLLLSFLFCFPVRQPIVAFQKTVYTVNRKFPSFVSSPVTLHFKASPFYATDSTSLVVNGSEAL